MHNPVKDEKKLYTFEEWEMQLKHSLNEYKNALVDVEDRNDFHKKHHTWDEWMTAFREWASW